jgi:hypothetical protein
MTRTLLLLTLLLLLTVTSGCGRMSVSDDHIGRSAADDFKIVVSGPDAHRRIGLYHYGASGTYASALRAFGQPSSRGTDNPLESNLCTVRWRRLGLDIGFATSAPRPCGPTRRGQGAWFGTTAYTRRWHTEKGLRIGDSEKRLRRLYPTARFHDLPPSPPFWSLVRQRRPDPVGVTDVLTAEVWDGVVVSISLPPDYIY